MTFHVYSKDQAGNPIQGVTAQVNVSETGQTYMRSSDGEGYSDLAIIDSLPGAAHGLIIVQKDGYATFQQYVDVGKEDQTIQAVLAPFV